MYEAAQVQILIDEWDVLPNSLMDLPHITARFQIDYVNCLAANQELYRQQIKQIF